jgi:hypothetical protein
MVDCFGTFFAELGSLLSVWARCDLILKGATPGELPGPAEN